MEKELVCEVCNSEPAVGVACIPYIAMSCAFGRKCLDAGAIPYWAAVANTACCGGIEHTNEGWKGVVQDTLKYLGKSEEQFTSDVQQCIDDMP